MSPLHRGFARFLGIVPVLNWAWHTLAVILMGWRGVISYSTHRPVLWKANPGETVHCSTFLAFTVICRRTTSSPHFLPHRFWEFCLISEWTGGLGGCKLGRKWVGIKGEGRIYGSSLPPKQNLHVWERIVPDVTDPESLSPEADRMSSSSLLLAGLDDALSVAHVSSWLFFFIQFWMT